MKVHPESLMQAIMAGNRIQAALVQARKGLPKRQLSTS